MHWMRPGASLFESERDFRLDGDAICSEMKGGLAILAH